MAKARWKISSIGKSEVSVVERKEFDLHLERPIDDNIIGDEMAITKGVTILSQGFLQSPESLAKLRQALVLGKDIDSKGHIRQITATPSYKIPRFWQLNKYRDGFKHQQKVLLEIYKYLSGEYGVFDQTGGPNINALGHSRGGRVLAQALSEQQLGVLTLVGSAGLDSVSNPLGVVTGMLKEIIVNQFLNDHEDIGLAGKVKYLGSIALDAAMSAPLAIAHGLDTTYGHVLPEIRVLYINGTVIVQIRGEYDYVFNPKSNRHNPHDLPYDEVHTLSGRRATHNLVNTEQDQISAIHLAAVALRGDIIQQREV